MMEEIKNRAFDARESYRAGFIGRSEAKADIMPYIVAVNEKSMEIARKYGMRPKKISFASFIR